ncbi:MAG TPA: Rne/Rng family ribonuclease [Sphingomonas sp.]|nr:Rne/Rng family ribonuclease [Sphingomonas sp.]
MSMRMLIDARHREETRVAVVKGNRIEEFDFESEEHKQLKGNIYLAKVTRVEPSLQAAFIDYGGNRHGFLAFSEIHPDYYQIPKEDREALLREEAEHAAEEEALRAREEEDEEDEIEGEARLDDDGGREYLDAAEDHVHDESDHLDEGDPVPPPRPTSTGGDDSAVESLRQKRMNLRRRYKIQDVIRRRQVLLVQVVKEERGNKGAALTTYLSLAGRYCVLMPNTSHGGGISRKISNASDRKRLKSILAELNLPRTMGCIVRTAGLQRTKPEIRRDFDYLARLWDEIRDKTLHSEAPAEIYRDSDLIKRAIRDIYNKDIDEVIVEGEEGYRAARTFMKLLMPTHAKKIVPYSDAIPLFQRFGVEDQLAAMYQPVVQLKSGGYIVINPTEALVSIDINSGRSTREHNIEQTATATNLEAAQEIARQLRLRDMAGLVVIDFIDMENSSNNRKVEKAMKEALRNDRARIQVGRISGFGLFEMSRQRLRTGVLEASTRMCPHCEGSGFIRTASSSGLQALRLLEEEAARGRGSRLCLRASQEAALYVLNRKRAELADIEDRYGVMIEVLSDGHPEGARMAVEASGPPPSHAPRLPQQIAPEPDDDIVEDEEEEEIEAEAGEPGREREESENVRRRRRRRRRGGRRDETDDGSGEIGADATGEPGGAVEADAVDATTDEAGGDENGGGDERRRGRRGRRGGRRRNRGDAPVSVDAFASEGQADVSTELEAVSETGSEPAVDAVADKPAGRRRPRARKGSEPVATPFVETVNAVETVDAVDATESVTPSEPTAEPAAKPRRRRRPKTETAVPEAEPAGASPQVAEAAPAQLASTADPAPARRRRSSKAAVEAPLEPIVANGADAAEGELDANGEPRRGWWQRTFGA